jgi:hypothetical protein
VPAYPSRVRALADCSASAVAAAMAADREEFLVATERLAGLDAEQVGLVLGAVLRSLLEDLHPDGLTGDEVQDVIVRCTTQAAGWYPEVDVNALVLVPGGALGVHPHEDEPVPVTPLDVARHAPLVVADLLTAGDRPYRPYLDAALTRIAEAEANDLP